MPEINTNLIPFSEPSGYKSRQGYLDETTGEIVIAAKYMNARPFAGGFAFVNTEKPVIINQSGEESSKEILSYDIEAAGDYFKQRGIDVEIRDGFTFLNIDYQPYINAVYSGFDPESSLRELHPGLGIPFERARPF
jgi:hypothetical protein